MSFEPVASLHPGRTCPPPSLVYTILQDCSQTQFDRRHRWQMDLSPCQLAFACRGLTSPPLCTASQSQQALPTHRPCSCSGQYVSHISLSPHSACLAHLSSSPLCEAASSGFASMARQVATWPAAHSSAAGLLYAALCRPHWLTAHDLLRWHGAPPHSSAASATPPHSLPAHPRHRPVTKLQRQHKSAEILAARERRDRPGLGAVAWQENGVRLSHSSLSSGLEQAQSRACHTPPPLSKIPPLSTPTTSSPLPSSGPCSLLR